MGNEQQSTAGTAAGGGDSGRVDVHSPAGGRLGVGQIQDQLRKSERQRVDAMNSQLVKAYDRASLPQGGRR